MPFIDARIPIRFGDPSTRTPGDAVLTDGPVASPPMARFGADPLSPGHISSCACCLPPSAAARALAGLFRERALGVGPAFTGVLATVSPAGEAAIRRALATDPLASGRYRCSPDGAAASGGDVALPSP